MRRLLLAVASPEILSWIGFLLLAGGLLGEVAVLLVPEKHLAHKMLGLLFAAIVLVGYVVGHIGDEKRAVLAEAKLKDITGPRDITPGERAALVSCLKDAPYKGVVHIRPGMIQGDAGANS